MKKRFEEVADPIELEILDWGAAAAFLLSLDEVTFVSVEGSAVPQLRREFSELMVDRRVPEAAIFSTVKSQVATFRKSPQLVERLLPLLALEDWSIFHLNLHGDSAKLVEGYDWGQGCCPVSLAGDLGAVADELAASAVARPWPEESE